jgi:hypothetical protein
MNDKYEMTVTINPLVSPLLYARLGQCATARERATVLRALAEATLRTELGSVTTRELSRSPYVALPAPLRESSYRSDASALPASTAMHAPTTSGSDRCEGFQTLRIADSTDNDAELDDALGSQLAGFLD